MIAVAPLDGPLPGGVASPTDWFVRSTSDRESDRSPTHPSIRRVSSASMCRLAPGVFRRSKISYRTEGAGMLAILEFPIGDCRGFVPEGTNRLLAPDWGSLRTWDPPQFVRGFGHAVARRGRIDGAWVDEPTYCRAARAIRFPDLARERVKARAPS